MAASALTGSEEQFQAQYDSFQHHTISFRILVNNEGQDRERSYDVWASRAEIEKLAQDGYLVRKAKSAAC